MVNISGTSDNAKAQTEHRNHTLHQLKSLHNNPRISNDSTELSYLLHISVLQQVAELFPTHALPLQHCLHLKSTGTTATNSILIQSSTPQNPLIQSRRLHKLLQFILLLLQVLLSLLPTASCHTARLRLWHLLFKLALNPTMASQEPNWYWLLRQVVMLLLLLHNLSRSPHQVNSTRASHI